MVPSRFALTAALSVGLAAANAACSHEEKPPVVTPRPVTQAPPPPARKVVAQAPAEPAEIPKQKEDLAVFFDFDSSLLKDDGRRVLQEVAAAVRKKNASLAIEGNCDELGTIEYNMALGEERARAAKTYLTHLGVPANKIATVSYGSQRPKYQGHDDDAHAKNRRDDLVLR